MVNKSDVRGAVPADAPARRTVGDKGGIWMLAAIALTFLTVGLWGGAGGVYSAHQDRELVSNGVHSIGRVTAVNFKTYRYSKVFTITTVPFVAGDGRQYSAEGRERYNERRDGPRNEFAAELMGRELTVFYDPADPGNSVIEGQERPYAGPIILLTLLGGLGAFGCLITLFGFIGLRQAKRNLQALS
ncbi:DUF3592 domain-containing protein [Arthrobacter sp. UYCu712]|uniref:DUF3592 domain-containing protein n=1 Tax=Arthrobacter sp. UYCu712 TaxID=3156340 RepID=UPI003393414A